MQEFALKTAVKSHNSAIFGDKSLMKLGPKVWNALPEKIKYETSYKTFKDYIDLWFGPIKPKLLG